MKPYLDGKVEQMATRCNFHRQLNLADPYAKLAAAIILQALYDSVRGITVDSHLDCPIHNFDVLADGIGLDKTYDELKEALFIRRYVYNERIPTVGTDFMK